MNEPASVTAERARLDAVWLEGADAGYHSTQPLPAFFSKPVNQLKPYERGYVFGYWLRQNEPQEPQP